LTAVPPRSLGGFGHPLGLFFINPRSKEKMSPLSTSEIWCFWELGIDRLPF
jgi:hypothetical protein